MDVILLGRRLVDRSAANSCAGSQVDRIGTAMYTYIVERTQIYLSREQADALDREARRTGTTRSHLIREAIAEKYGTARDVAATDAVLRSTAGAWATHNEDGAQYVEQLRTGRRWDELYSDEPASDDAEHG
jgi:predicted DNA-binding protein